MCTNTFGSLPTITCGCGNVANFIEKKTLLFPLRVPVVVPIVVCRYCLYGVKQSWPDTTITTTTTTTITTTTTTATTTNKNAFQLKAHLPLANRKSNTYNLTLE